ncbi:hypothetical protein BJ170DRAFT_682847 [Xylariales sp. AK1849]|nr:hypothetical protein BJ170DRAFT_682847 [Xylariales sp. AK1849]
MDEVGERPLVTSNKLRCLGLGRRPATAQGFDYDFDSCPGACPGYWKQARLSQRNVNARAKRINRQRKATHNSRRWALDSEDGAALARSNIRLPSDGGRQKPRLERQEAFQVPKTIFTSDVVENDADLYRLGLLYSDETARGSGFDLDKIVHPEPIYAIRPAKRTWKGRCAKSQYEDPSLALDLSFSSLDADFVLAQFLSSDFGTKAHPVDEAAPCCTDGDLVPASEDDSRPLHVIYELLEDSTHSLAPPPAVDIFPDLVSDSEGVEDGNDWDMVPHLQWGDSGASAVADAVEVDVGAATEAWVVLGET